jgi:predicted nuclease with TOPRIM domain
MGEQETAVAVLQEKVKSLEAQMAALQEDVREKFDRLEAKLDEALRGRPTWAVTMIISALLTITTGLSVYVITH